MHLLYCICLPCFEKESFVKELFINLWYSLAIYLLVNIAFYLTKDTSTFLANFSVLLYIPFCVTKSGYKLKSILIRTSIYGDQLLPFNYVSFDLIIIF